MCKYIKSNKTNTIVNSNSVQSVTCASSPAHVQPSVVCTRERSRDGPVSGVLGPLACTRRGCWPHSTWRSLHFGAVRASHHYNSLLRTGNKGVTVETLPSLACSGWWMDRWKLRDKWQRFHDELLCLGGYIVVVVHQTWSAYCTCGDTIPYCAVEYSGWEAGSSFTTFSYA